MANDEGQKDVEKEEENVEVSKKNFVGRIVGKLNKKDPDAAIAARNEALIELLKPVRYSPCSVDELCRRTQLEPREVKRLYRAFKQLCPDGISCEESFKEIFEQIFPLGDSSKYAHLVFMAIDRENIDRVTFGDFIEFLSTMTNGSTEAKIKWAFQFCDMNRDGVLSRDEISRVVEAVHELLGPDLKPKNVNKQVEEIFGNIDIHKEGVITWEQFHQHCTESSQLYSIIAAFP